LKQDLESFFISQFKNKFIGDDGAVLGNIKNSVVVQDAFFENVHFKREWFSLDEVAYKSVAVNISDIYSMNAEPKFALLTVAIPKGFSKNDLKQLATGFHRAEKDFKFQIVGGDTISNSKLDISVTIIGKLRDKPILRKNAQVGDLIAFFEIHNSKIGMVKRDLEKLLSGQKIKKNSRFIKPILFPKVIFQLSKYISSGLDISDGVFSELKQIAKNSRVGFKINKNLSKNILCSGEEYLFLFTFPKRNLSIVNNIIKKNSLYLNIFGKITFKSKINDVCKPHHFK
jgi:thiamine-monophosphate kinase